MKSLLQTIKDNAALIDAEMLRLIDGGEKPYKVLTDSMVYSAGAGGKRIRPYLTLETCRMLGGRDEAALPYACAIEMIHTYSLIHDDLPCMDNDEVRRGKPTNHVVFGEANALLAGDALLTKAFGVAASNSYVTAENTIEAIKLLSENAGIDGMIGGQVLDLEGEKRTLGEDEHLMMNRMKTGCLIRTAALLGCLAAGYTESTPEYTAVKKYSENIGLAFQIEDDLLDIGTEDNKTTFLSFMTKEEAQRKIDELTDGAIEAISGFKNNETLTFFARYLSKREL